MNYNKLAEEAHENAVKHGFWETKVSNEHCLMLVITEIAEMVEAHRVSRKASIAAYNEMLNKQIRFECFIKNTTGYDMAHDTMRTDAMVAILMVRYLKAHDNKMNAIIKAKMGHSESITNPQMIDLEGLMKAYLPKGFVVGTNYQLDLCAKIFENSLAKIEFDITD